MILHLLGMVVLKADIKLMTAEEIYDELKRIGGDLFNHVTISGGNPALIKGIQELVDLFQDKGIFQRTGDTRQ
ncbi:Queuosine Biosynthesis QueE Radical SAM [Staphylococcus aureus]|uniref:Queuosine Biosynthesis QueE Radical SAM n=1 Tax=Staphylococcus aureus TaxID=1280 RepID=A0A380E2W0_STAAU|nr:Queuosine Biosynthesis QueE Radical SAM [Staphylococcus aureus]